MSSRQTTPISVSLIGAGRVGAQLAMRLHQRGVLIRHVFNRNHHKAIELATSVQAEAVQTLSAMAASKADVLIIAVKDSVISDVANAIKLHNPACLVVHTSGTCPIDVFAAGFSRYGGLYPLMSFGTQPDLPWSQVPVGINANQSADLQLLRKLVRSLGAKPFLLLDQQRIDLHVAAVFANNFTNHILGIAFDTLKKAGLDQALLKPLIEHTVQQALLHDPHLIQTGPAVRHDTVTIAAHLEFLSKQVKTAQLYQLLTDLIQQQADNQLVK
jgi:predicted short-subunit dehydrogenase-like oxidoreductase (DUF2520 family)